MKNLIKTAIVLLSMITLVISLGACLRSPDENNNTKYPPPSKEYFTVTFETGDENITAKPETVINGATILEPFLKYRNGYRLLGWKADGENELFDFSERITKDITLTAVWEAEEPGHIYDSMTPIYIIHDGSESAASFANTITNKLSLSSYMGVGSGLYLDTPEKYHELVIGKTDREISKKAYAELEKLSENDGNISYLIYSDGKSVAFVYTDAEEKLALSLLKTIALENYIKRSMSLVSGVYESYTITADDYYLELDEKKFAEDWKLLEDYLATDIGTEGAASFVSALKDLYSLYKPEMTEWYAKLYAPEIGGYYYSNSARDNASVTYQGATYPLLPDIESTNQALNFIISSGMSGSYAQDLPSYMREQIVSFVKSCQDENGYFYHPQWPKSLTDSKTSRRSRDLSWAENILQKFGATPIYTTPNGMQGSTVKSAGYLTLSLSDMSVSLVSQIVTCAVTNTNLKDKASFESYLSSLDIANRSYHVGNELTAQGYEILERDRQLKKEGADYSLMSILINWLNENQDPATGHWQKGATNDKYYGVNGLLKISGIYNSAQVPMPNAKAATQSAIAAITLDEPLGAVVDIYNTWFTIDNVVKNIRKYGSAADNIYADEMVHELRLSAPAAIAKSKEKIAVFQKPDGSFSYTPSYSSNTSQGMPVAIYGSYEGDVNATGISSTGLIGYMMQALELNSYKPALFGKTEFRKYLSIIGEKNAELTKREPLDLSGYSKIDFDNGDIPERITTSFYSSGTSSVTDSALLFTTSSGGNDSLFIKAEGSGGNAVIFNADITLSAISGSDTLFQLLFSDSANTTAYMPVIGYKNGRITLSDASSTGDASIRKVQEMKNDILVGEKFNLGIEYYVLDDGSIRVKLFVDGVLVYVSDNYYNSHSSTSPSTTSIEKMRFYSLNAAAAAMALDNIVFVHDNVNYIDLALGAK